MKILQNNFTTPEQSKRLVELGLPADSADCVYELKQIGTQFIMSKTPDIIPSTMRLSWRNRIPCWSVGRLIEIYIIVRGLDTAYLPFKSGEDMVKCLIRLYEEKAKDLDFSKLEE